MWNWTAEKTAKWLTPAIEMPYLVERWGSMDFCRILDNGCGPGRHSIYFAQKGFCVTGLDQSETALSHLSGWAQEENLSIYTVSGSIFSLPFPENYFDGIIDYNVSYHTDTAGFLRAIAELHRVLRPGGECYITLLSQSAPSFISAPPEAHLDQYTLIHAGGTPHFYGSREALGQLFGGFTMALPPREICTRGLDSSEESTHFHLLLKKEQLCENSEKNIQSF